MRRAHLATAVLPLVLSVAAAVFLVLLPCFQMSESRRVTVGGQADGHVVIARQCRSLLEATDYRALYFLLVPVLLAALLLLSALRGWKIARELATVLLAAFVLLTGFSIGLFFAPAALAGAISLAFQSSPSPHAGDGIPHN